MFATGLECSYPTVEHGKRRDELESTKHYTHWRRDFQLCKEIGADYVRYGPPYYRMHTAPHQYDWSWTDETLPVMRDMGLIPIIDLCHFGVPDWVGGFQNTDWPELFADYVGEFSRRYPWISFYTPVNEMLVCARFSAKHGIWNEQLKSDQAMVTAITNMCRATHLAMEQILKQCPDAVFFQSEVAEVLLERWPSTRDEVNFKNELRFVTFDLLYGHAPHAEVALFLLDNGMSRDRYRWFMDRGPEARRHCVMGTDYYSRNERLVHPDGSEEGIGSVLGWEAIADEYFGRYRKPIMLTETNSMDPDAGPSWLWNLWNNIRHSRSRGVPVLGFTWYSLTDQVDWDIQLKEIRNKQNPNGLFDLDRNPRPAAQAFRDLTTRYHDLPMIEDFAMGGIPAPRHGRAPADDGRTPPEIERLNPLNHEPAARAL